MKNNACDKQVKTNRRPALPLDTDREFASNLCAPTLLSDANAHLRR